MIERLFNYLVSIVYNNQKESINIININVNEIDNIDSIKIDENLEPEKRYRFKIDMSQIH